MSLGKEARRLYLEENFNCAEAAWLGMAKDVTKDEKAFGCRLAGGFGGGLACGSVCGALAGAVMGLGLFLGREPGQPRADKLREVTKQLSEAFAKEFGSINCSDIKQEGDGYRARCADFVEFCVNKANELVDLELDDDDFDCG
ncbi:MAG TPA: C_GCAxxG_C_C family protein [Firmicutes bacterium]|jgi:C_GCAxxG_C_C family probable redox protein|nr:C_GCAxxG_C_C family protein [Bacillota bacterium]